MRETASAAAEAEARKLELARNRLKYTVLRASRSGVVTAVRFEVGQVVAEGQPVVSIANEGEPEIVADVPEDHLSRIQERRATRRGSQARPSRRSTSRCANCRRRRRRRRARSAPA